MVYSWPWFGLLTWVWTLQRKTWLSSLVRFKDLSSETGTTFCLLHFPLPADFIPSNAMMQMMKCKLRSSREQLTENTNEVKHLKINHTHTEKDSWTKKHLETMFLVSCTNHTGSDGEQSSSRNFTKQGECLRNLWKLCSLWHWPLGLLSAALGSPHGFSIPAASSLPAQPQAHNIIVRDRWVAAPPKWHFLPREGGKLWETHLH